MAVTPAHVRRAAAALHATACLQPTRPTDVRIQLWSFRDIPSGRARLVRVIKGRSTDRQLFDLVDLVTVAQLFSMPPSVVWLDPVGAVEELDPRLAVGRIAAESLLSIDGALVRQRVRTTARGAVDEPGATTDPLPIDVRSWERARLAVSADANDVLDELIELGAVGEIGGRFYDAAGEPVSSSLVERTVSVPLDAVRACPTSILVSGGVHRRESILGALRGGFATILVTDTETAEWLVMQEKGRQ